MKKSLRRDISPSPRHFRSQRGLFAATLFALVVTSPPAAMAANKQALSVEQLVKSAVSNNPLLRKLRYNALSYKEKIPQAGVFPDPMVTLALVNMPLDTRYTPMTGVQVGLMQLFPVFGKRGLRRKVARYRYLTQNYRVEEATNRLTARVKLAYHRLQFVVAEIALVKKDRKILMELVSFAKAKYGVGIGHQADVLKAQVALVRIVNRLIKLNSQRRLVKAELNSLCARSPESPLADPPRPTFKLTRIDSKQLGGWMEQHNPLLKSIGQKRKQFQAALRLAKRQYYPDFRLGLSYRFRVKHQNDPVKGADFIGLSVGFNLPVFTKSKLDPRVREMQARIDQSSAELSDAKNRLLLRISQLRIKMQTIARQIKLYNGALLPPARQAVTAAKLGYQSNKLDFMTVLNNQLLVFKLESDVERLKSEYSRMRAALEWAVGRKLQ